MFSNLFVEFVEFACFSVKTSVLRRLKRVSLLKVIHMGKSSNLIHSFKEMGKFLVRSSKKVLVQFE